MPRCRNRSWGFLMGILTRRHLLFALIPIAVVIVGSALALSSSAADREMMGDWVITGGVTNVSNETIDVRGNVIVQDGGVLKLDNCTLVINGSQDGAFRLEINSTGHLEALNSRIYGSPGRMWVRIHNDSLLRGCTLEHTHASSMERGIMLQDGDITIRDTIVNDTLYYGMVVCTGLTLVNVTMMGAQMGQLLITNTLLSDDSNLRIEDCHFDGYKPGTGRTNSGVQIACYSGYKEITMLVKNTRLESFNQGMNIGGSGGLSFTAEDCEVLNCQYGFYIGLTGGSATLRGNVLRQSSVYIRSGNYASFFLEDNLIMNNPSGLGLSAAWGGIYSCTVENLTVRNCTDGVAATGSAGGGRIDVTIRNSSLESVDTGFVAGEHVRISIYDTDFEVGSGRVTGQDSWIKAYCTLDPQSVRWRGGAPIVEGMLSMENESRVMVATIDLSSPAPKTILGWEMTSTTQSALEFLYPVLYIEDHDFMGDEYDLWSGTPTVIEIVDDVFPEVEITFPTDMMHFNGSRLAMGGRYWELGSGLAHLEVSFDSTAYYEFYSFQEERWNLTLYNLADGTYNISVRGVDSVGNLGNASSVTFVVDTVRPVLLIEPLPGLVNHSDMTVSGRTEPNSWLTIDDNLVPLEPDGSFVIGITLEEGTNTLRVLAKDLAGNENGTTLRIVCDTIPPSLDITSPTDGMWVKSASIEIEGTTEPGSNLSIMGVVVQDVEGAFCHRVALTEGEFPINVLSQDEAGNTAVAVVVLHVDWTAPGLTVIRPGSDSVVTRDRELWISGEVDDPTIDNLTINGRMVELFSGGFAKQVLLVEGLNEFEIVVSDAAGNTNSSTIVAIRDLSSPEYEVELTAPEGAMEEIGEKLYSTASTLQAHITIDEAAIVVFQNGTRTPSSDEHRLRFDLQEGRNVLRFDIEDRAGNRAPSYAQEVLLDTTPPFIIVYEPLSGITTKNESVVLHGFTEEGSYVSVNGAPVEVMQGGEFRLLINLVGGRNEITIEVVDVVGHANSTTVTVVREVEEEPIEESSGLLIASSAVAILSVCAVLVFLALKRHRRAGHLEEAQEMPSSPPTGPPKRTEPPEGGLDTPDEWEEY